VWGVGSEGRGGDGWGKVRSGGVGGVVGTEGGVECGRGRGEGHGGRGWGGEVGVLDGE